MVILTWEFPPRIIGEIALHVSNLAISLARRKVDVYVITYHDSHTGMQVNTEGVKVVRVSNPVSTHFNILTWDLTLTTEFERVSAEIFYSLKGDVDLIDAYEWLCVTAAVGLKKAFDIPFLFTVHSLEDHRSRGASYPLSLGIKSLENLGFKESERVIVQSDWMKEEVKRVYRVSEAKIDVVPPNSPMWVEKIISAYQRVIESSTLKAKKASEKR